MPLKPINGSYILFSFFNPPRDEEVPRLHTETLRKNKTKKKNKKKKQSNKQGSGKQSTHCWKIEKVLSNKIQ